MIGGVTSLEDPRQVYGMVADLYRGGFTSDETPLYL
jgi:hypothetical protein